MRVACLGLLLLLANLCGGELLTFRSQGSDTPGVHSETLVLVDDGEADDPRFVGMLQQYDLSSINSDAQQLFSAWPTASAFLDGGWQTWMEQQLTALDSLQSMLMIPRCPHAAAQATPPQSDYPSLLSYMAASRFGPSVLTAYARQVDQDMQPGAVSMSVYSASADENEQAIEYSADESQPTLADDFATAFSIASQPRNLEDANWFGSQNDNDFAEVFSRSPLFHSSGERDLSTNWEDDSFQTQADAEEAADDAFTTPAFAWGETCNLGLFLVLCIGCLAVWAAFVRAWVSCCRLEQQAKAAKKASIVPNPLLMPLIPEGVTSLRNPAFESVEVAAEHPMEGTYYAPQGSEYVSIAYMPLQSEAHSRA